MRIKVGLGAYKEDEPRVTVVDSCMGSGKTSMAINMINNSPKYIHYIYITPYLEEIERIKDACPSKNFKQPIYEKGKSKLDNVKKLIEQGENIVATHALFKKFNKETINLVKLNEYILIMDEVAEVINIYSDRITDDENGKRLLSKHDIESILEGYGHIDEKTKLLVWDDKSYTGVFKGIKNMANLDSLTMYGDQNFLWTFPVQVFEAFIHTYVLTYLFEAQIQSYYYKLHNIEYKKVGIEEESGIYKIGEYKENEAKYDYKNLINILEKEKLNDIGKDRYALSASWYEKATVEKLDRVKKNIYNFFHQYSDTKTKDNIWTTFKVYKKDLSGKGYTKGFISLNMRASNKYKDCTAVAYTVNRFMNPIIRNYFSQQGIEVDEDGYALSEMLQFIWRSGIRDGNPIQVYIPSSRMRKLLKQWINKQEYKGQF